MTRLFWHDYNYFPYELDFARREARALTGSLPQDADGGLVVSGRIPSEDRLRALTYFKAFTVGQETVVPDQARLEASAGAKYLFTGFVRRHALGWGLGLA